MSFDKLGLSKKVLDAVDTSGYSEPTPIQAKAIPHIMEHRDVLGIAQTGTGKTASFTLPMLSILEKGRARARMPRSLILEPTRELAAQVEENFIKYGQNHKLNVALLIGGVSFEDQIKKLDRGVDVLIATPGRLLDHFERGKLLMSSVDILVIDEADRMLDMGFIPDIERICKLLPFTRQTLFFSATMPPEIENLAAKFLHNPVEIAVAKKSSTSDTITQYAVKCGSKDYEKRQTLRDLLDQADDLQNAIIFCNRKRDVANLWRSLDRHGYSCGALHGDMDQRSRTTMLNNFRDGEIKLLVASDVAARGLDIPNVSHVFNFDVPINAEDYVHRIGRTGRAGRQGITHMLIAPIDKKNFKAIEKLIGKSIAMLESDQAETPVREKKSSGSKSNKNLKTKSETSATVKEELPASGKSGNRKKPGKPDPSRRYPAFADDDHIPAFLLREPR
jgi:superfamily II DNA/RNA helicase